MKGIGFLFLISLLGGGVVSPASALDYEEYPSIRLRSLDKITARTLTFDAQVGNTIKFGDIYIKILSCRKPPPVEKTEAAAFLQIWQTDKAQKESHWIFSGWMFASSPALSGMDHPVYDVWVMDCLGKDPEAMPEPETKPDAALPDEGTVPEGTVEQPAVAPEEQKTETPVEDTKSQMTPADTVSPSVEQPIQPEPKETAPVGQGQEENIDGIY